MNTPAPSRRHGFTTPVAARSTRCLYTDPTDSSTCPEWMKGFEHVVVPDDINTDKIIADIESYLESLHKDVSPASCAHSSNAHTPAASTESVDSATSSLTPPTSWSPPKSWSDSFRESCRDFDQFMRERDHTIPIRKRDRSHLSRRVRRWMVSLSTVVKRYTRNHVIRRKCRKWMKSFSKWTFKDRNVRVLRKRCLHHTRSTMKRLSAFRKSFAKATATSCFPFDDVGCRYCQEARILTGACFCGNTDCLSGAMMAELTERESVRVLRRTVMYCGWNLFGELGESPPVELPLFLFHSGTIHSDPYADDHCDFSSPCWEANTVKPDRSPPVPSRATTANHASPTPLKPSSACEAGRPASTSESSLAEYVRRARLCHKLIEQKIPNRREGLPRTTAHPEPAEPDWADERLERLLDQEAWIAFPSRRRFHQLGY